LLDLIARLAQLNQGQPAKTEPAALGRPSEQSASRADDPAPPSATPATVRVADPAKAVEEARFRERMASLQFTLQLMASRYARDAEAGAPPDAAAMNRASAAHGARPADTGREVKAIGDEKPGSGLASGRYRQNGPPASANRDVPFEELLRQALAKQL
jgi:hypothetical protein